MGVLRLGVASVLHSGFLSGEDNDELHSVRIKAAASRLAD